MSTRYRPILYHIPMCFGCNEKKSLYLCANCQIAAYCSEQCAKKHKEYGIHLCSRKENSVEPKALTNLIGANGDDGGGGVGNEQDEDPVESTSYNTLSGEIRQSSIAGNDPIIKTTEKALLQLLKNTFNRREGTDNVVNPWKDAVSKSQTDVLSMIDPNRLSFLLHELTVKSREERSSSTRASDDDDDEYKNAQQMLEKLLSGKNRDLIIKNSRLLSDETKQALVSLNLSIPIKKDQNQTLQQKEEENVTRSISFLLWFSGPQEYTASDMLFVPSQKLRPTPEQFLTLYSRMVRVQPQSDLALKLLTRLYLEDYGLDDALSLFGEVSLDEYKLFANQFIDTYAPNAPKIIRYLMDPEKAGNPGLKAKIWRMTRNVHRLKNNVSLKNGDNDEDFMVKLLMLGDESTWKQYYLDSLHKFIGDAGETGESMNDFLGSITSNYNLVKIAEIPLALPLNRDDIFSKDEQNASQSRALSRRALKQLFLFHGMLVITYLFQDDIAYREALMTYQEQNGYWIPDLYIAAVLKPNVLFSMSSYCYFMRSYYAFSMLVSVSVFLSPIVHYTDVLLLVMKDVLVPKLDLVSEISGDKDKSSKDKELIRYFPTDDNGLVLALYQSMIDKMEYETERKNKDELVAGFFRGTVTAITILRNAFIKHVKENAQSYGYQQNQLDRIPPLIRKSNRRAFTRRVKEHRRKTEAEKQQELNIFLKRLDPYCDY